MGTPCPYTGPVQLMCLSDAVSKGTSVFFFSSENLAESHSIFQCVVTEGK